MKKLFTFILALCLLSSLTGCVALLAGAGGTALWQAGKVISEEQVSMEKGSMAVESAFKAKGIILENKVARNDVTQLRGKDKNDLRVAVDVFSKGDKNIKIEIRYGIGDETLARDLLNQIKRYL
ncbi:MAG: DUF3568 family protein [Candidatus Omnitrophica bacterium]|nr:DUF3568 family protein [Candidatus Omnitrophota bacterium]